MEITLSLIPYEDKTILQNLMQLYRYDSSEFDGHVLTKHGLYLYKYLDHQWTDDYRRPYLVKADGELAGFALVSLDVPKEFTKLSNAEKTNVISDFFIMRKFRRKGVGKRSPIHFFKNIKECGRLDRQRVTCRRKCFGRELSMNIQIAVYIKKKLFKAIAGMVRFMYLSHKSSLCGMET
ncbi:GNAT family N-acetyltransferase [Bacillus niameyensis]|uniref:GNAT family N-acetyltransferase n=1 Tax=Bacillus niameyensis TaxID=1522308 RepID=UPI000B1B1164|nr:GNAT family N-acetyltransferase [Bacillus niameyensis]